jgi:hypothetical protein
MNVTRLRKKVVVDKPLGAVFGYLSDFTTTTEWDPATVRTVRQEGEGEVGTTYLNTSKFLGRESDLLYRVIDFRRDECIKLCGENKTLVAFDTMTFKSVPDGTEVTYTAEFALKGVAKAMAPLLRPAFERLGANAEKGLRSALLRL